MSNFGVPRQGAGRPKGALTKRTQEVLDKAAEKGITPLEVMLENMWFAHGKAGAILTKIIDGSNDKPDGWSMVNELLKYRQMAQDAAKDAAPYMHPRLASVEHAGKNDATHDRSFTITIGTAKITEEPKRLAHLDS